MSKEKVFHIIGGQPEYDDCEICKAMQKAENEGREITPEELGEAMAKQDEINFMRKMGIYEN